MSIDEYIAELTKVRQTHGPDLQIVRANPETLSFVRAGLPRVAWARVDKPKTLFDPKNGFDKNKGVKVVRL